MWCLLELFGCSEQFKTPCRLAGTIKYRFVEIQGDHVATVMAAQVLLGYAVKRSGG
jgi:translation initiation factor 1 (eIF-1/SUI1)